MILVVVIVSSGCSTITEAPIDKSAGESRVFEAGYDRVWKAAKIAILDYELELISENPRRGELLATSRTSRLNSGTQVAIYIESVGNSALTRVKVVSDTAVASNNSTQSWGHQLLGSIHSQVR